MSFFDKNRAKNAFKEVAGGAINGAEILSQNALAAVITGGRKSLFKSWV